MPPLPPIDIHLRATTPADVPKLFELQADPASNELAGTKPRDLQTFNARWIEVFRDARITPRVIIADGVFVGSINIFPQEETDSIGYWIAREHWGRGIATRAIRLLIDEVPIRPLYARVGAGNVASLRALARNGFAVVSRCHTPETDRNVARDTITLTLA